MNDTLPGQFGATSGSSTRLCGANRPEQRRATPSRCPGPRTRGGSRHCGRCRRRCRSTAVSSSTGQHPCSRSPARAWKDHPECSRCCSGRSRSSRCSADGSRVRLRSNRSPSLRPSAAPRSGTAARRRRRVGPPAGPARRILESPHDAGGNGSERSGSESRGDGRLAETQPPAATRRRRPVGPRARRRVRAGLPRSRSALGDSRLPSRGGALVGAAAAVLRSARIPLPAAVRPALRPVSRSSRAGRRPAVAHPLGGLGRRGRERAVASGEPRQPAGRGPPARPRSPALDLAVPRRDPQRPDEPRLRGTARPRRRPPRLRALDGGGGRPGAPRRDQAARDRRRSARALGLPAPPRSPRRRAGGPRGAAVPLRASGLRPLAVPRRGRASGGVVGDDRDALRRPRRAAAPLRRAALVRRGDDRPRRLRARHARSLADGGAAAHRAGASPHARAARRRLPPAVQPDDREEHVRHRGSRAGSSPRHGRSSPAGALRERCSPPRSSRSASSPRRSTASIPTSACGGILSPSASSPASSRWRSSPSRRPRRVRPVRSASARADDPDAVLDRDLGAERLRDPLQPRTGSRATSRARRGAEFPSA